MSSEIQPPNNLSVNSLRIGIVSAKFNTVLADSLLQRVLKCISLRGEPEKLTIERVPGSHEIPVALSLILNSGNYSCLIALGVVIKGATSHHNLVAESSGNAIQNLSVSFNVPIINGIVVADNIADAEERIIGKLDRGHEFAHAAIEMGNLHKKWTKI